MTIGQGTGPRDIKAYSRIQVTFPERQLDCTSKVLCRNAARIQVPDPS